MAAGNLAAVAPVPSRTVVVVVALELRIAGTILRSGANRRVDLGKVLRNQQTMGLTCWVGCHANAM